MLERDSTALKKEGGFTKIIDLVLIVRPSEEMIATADELTNYYYYYCSYSEYMKYSFKNSQQQQIIAIDEKKEK